MAFDSGKVGAPKRTAEVTVKGRPLCPIDTPYQPTLPIHHVNPPYQPALLTLLRTYLMNPPTPHPPPSPPHFLLLVSVEGRINGKAFEVVRRRGPKKAELLFSLDGKDQTTQARIPRTTSHMLSRPLTPPITHPLTHPPIHPLTPKHILAVKDTHTIIHSPLTPPTNASHTL